MSRIRFPLAVCASLVCVGSGCTHFIELRAIEQFSAALHQEDLDGLKSGTSDEFGRKALRLTESLDDLKILRLPEDKTSIVKVEDVSDHEKRVTVKVGESKRRLLYKLTKDVESKKWVVDDIYVRQKRKGVTAVKSVTEQMDLLLTVREFLAAWKEGGRDDVLRITTPEFGQQLAKLPPIYLAQLTKQVTGERSPKSKLRPEAQMGEGEAVVRLPRTTGEMVVSMKLQAGAWKVADVAVESKESDEHIPSVRKTARIISTTIAFLEAYNTGDKQAFSRLCTDEFQKSLAPADFSAIRLPTADGLHGAYKVKYHKTHATFVIPGVANVVNISLKRSESKDESVAEAESEYLVEEVTVYDPDGRQEKRLSALFTAHAVMQLFFKSLAGHDLPMLRRLATPDFSRRVWEQLDETLLADLPLVGAGGGARTAGDRVPSVTAVEYRGSVTRITALHGARELTYVLRNWNGRLRVDDVLAEMPKCPASLKTTLELMIPICRFASAIRGSTLYDDSRLARESRLDREPPLVAIGRYSSADFNRLVWKQAERFPNVGVTVADRMQEPLASVALKAGKATVKLGSESSGAHVDLVKEHDRWVVDEVLLVAGLEPSQRQPLKKTLRIELANSFKPLRRPARTGLSPESADRTRFEAVPTPAAEPLQPPRQQEPEETLVVPPWQSQSEPLR